MSDEFSFGNDNNRVWVNNANLGMGALYDLAYKLKRQRYVTHFDVLNTLLQVNFMLPSTDIFIQKWIMKINTNHPLDLRQNHVHDHLPIDVASAWILALTNTIRENGLVGDSRPSFKVVEDIDDDEDEDE